jgi:hypothetical protein
MICRWDNSADDTGDGIYYIGSNALLFDAMLNYLAHGETVEILKYARDKEVNDSHFDAYNEVTQLRDNEREAHKET